MNFKIILLITNLVRRIHNKFVVCDSKLMIRCEAKLIDGFPDINELYKNTTKNLEKFLEKVSQNRNNDPIDFEIVEVSVFEENETLEEPVYSNNRIANKKMYCF